MATDSGANPFLEGCSAIRSLNRARIASLPDGVTDAGLLGKTGYELLGAASLRREVAAVARRHGLPLRAIDPILDVDGWLVDHRWRPRAMEIAGRYGRSLGVLLVGLRRADAPTRRARLEWADRHWSFWGSVREVRIGGGLMAGRFGEAVVDAARTVLVRAGETGLALERARHPAHLPVIGLARCLQVDATRAVVLDFGQTWVKRGLVSFDGVGVRSIELLDHAPSPCRTPVDRDPPDADVRRLWASMAGLVLDTVRALPEEDRPRAAIGIGVACYVDHGHPPPEAPGCYASLRRLGPNLAAFAAADVPARLGHAATVVMRGDGDAAGAACAGLERSVVITLGTAIGVGFPPPEGAVRPLAAGFEVIPPR